MSSVPKPPDGKSIDYELAALLAYCKLGESVTFPAGSMQNYLDSLLKMANDHGMPDDISENSIAFADTVSSVILNWSEQDKYAETRSASRYSVGDTPGRWVPTPPAYASASEPHWNMIRNLVIDSVHQFIPPPPYPYNVTDSNCNYYKEVKKIEKAIDTLTP